MLRPHHRERHAIGHVGWLRAAVLGAHDGILSTASLIVGVAGASPGSRAALVAGSAGLVAGALSMAAGEYVSVSSQSDVETADLAREAQELEDDPIGEHRELAGIYRQRGLQQDLATEVATQLMAHDALTAHARDELGLSDLSQARPLQAALTSAASFATGALVPLAVAALAPPAIAPAAVILASLLVLIMLGATSARIGRAPLLRAIVRTSCFGAAAMLITLAIGRLIGNAV